MSLQGVAYVWFYFTKFLCSSICVEYMGTHFLLPFHMNWWPPSFAASDADIGWLIKLDDINLLGKGWLVGKLLNRRKGYQLRTIQENKKGNSFWLIKDISLGYRNNWGKWTKVTSIWRRKRIYLPNAGGTGELVEIYSACMLCSFSMDALSDGSIRRSFGIDVGGRCHQLDQESRSNCGRRDVGLSVWAIDT